ncbi:tRNA (adenosine(37)-N6)-dimethylallyltransferase MiaA [Megasphaera hexanoica]|uniref:tRNA dimethylallyltransferase n=1 Tax=Megasphaera hexanoica TaxID=1675036 RepID=A0ABW7DLP0_9FIRM|nr:tRNA (adenosine(37)-N6)-dimethylallyltransferase MiaA [Megasphaera hexanoica]AXB82015.1 tRNA dimethylallyltransferase [Megasphaera hexanoica]
MDKVIAIAGPTAVGKTALSFYLADHYHTELISGDAYQIYRGMDIGTAKPTQDELSRFRHHLIDIASPDEPYSAARFCDMAAETVHTLNKTHKVPILVGGTGLYVQAFLEGFDFEGSAVTEQERECARKHIQAMTEQELRTYIMEQTQWQPADWHELLANTHRLVRLMVAVDKGEGAAFVRAGHGHKVRYDAYVIGLSLPREVLYDRIEKRVDMMLDAGWPDEVAGLLQKGISPASQAMKAIGYEELALYVRGKISLADAAEEIKKRTRRFAKRQITWFKRMPYIHWYAKQDYASEKELAAAVMRDTDGWIAEHPIG